jgi:hypothetical protein
MVDPGVKYRTTVGAARHLCPLGANVLQYQG